MKRKSNALAAAQCGVSTYKTSNSSNDEFVALKFVKNGVNISNKLLTDTIDWARLISNALNLCTQITRQNRAQLNIWILIEKNYFSFHELTTSSKNAIDKFIDYVTCIRQIKQHASTFIPIFTSSSNTHNH